MAFSRDVNYKEGTLPGQWREGDLTVTRGTAWTAPGCHDGCGVLMYTNEDGELVKVEGDLENPFNQGRLCVRCLDLPEVLKNPNRLLHPMKRAREFRGQQDKWERISWDEAYELITEEFNRIKEEYGAESVVFARGTGRDIQPIVRLATSYGSPNHTCFAFSGDACYVPRVCATMLVTGCYIVNVDCSQWFRDRYNHEGWKAPDTLAVWGNNPLNSNADGFYGHWVIDCMKRGTELIVVDPRVTFLATRAKYHLAIRPGTDGALALAWMNVIINEDLYDHEFVEGYCSGFEALAERVQEMPPSRAAEICWVNEQDIVESARLFAKSDAASILWGLAVDQTKHSFTTAHGLLDIMAITGNVDKPGGMVTYKNPYDIDQMTMRDYDYLSPEQAMKRIGINAYPIMSFGIPLSHPDETVFQMETGDPYPIKGMWIQTTNSIACMASEPHRIYDIMSKLDFVAAADPFMTPTIAAFADVVLPVAMYPEEDGLYSESNYSLNAIAKAAKPAGECKSDYEICLELGKHLNPDAWPWETVEDFLTYQIEGTTGLTFPELKAQGGMLYTDYEYYKYKTGKLRGDGEPGFNTPSGKFELQSIFFGAWGYDDLPTYKEVPESPISTPELFAEYPLVFTSGARHIESFHSEHRQIPRLRNMHPWPELLIHPDDAEKYGIVDGQWVWIENQRGRGRQKAKITPTMKRGVVNADHGWWYPEEDGSEPNLFGVWKSNINTLIKFDCGESGMGASYKSMLCKVYPVKEEEM